MIFPLRCFTCGKLIGNKIASYEEQIKPIIEKAKVSNTKPEFGKVLDNLGFKRYCCRKMFLSHLPLIKKIDNPYKETGNYFSVD